MKEKTALTLILLFTSILTFSQSITDSLIAFYPFVGNSNDVSVNNLNATVHGATLTTDRFGNSNGAYSFDGIDDFIELPNDPRIKSSFPYSISMWVTFDGFHPQYSTRVFTNEDNPAGYGGFWVNVNTDRQVGAFYGDGTGFGSGGRRNKITTLQVDTVDWFHIVVVFNQKDDIDIYIDCLEEAGTYSGSATTTTPFYTSSTPAIARTIHPVSRFFKGKLDEIAFWNRALSYSEAIALCDNMPIVLDIDGEIKEEENSFCIYPNPVIDKFTLKFDNETSKQKLVLIVNSLGQVVYEYRFKANELIVEETFPAGLYVVRVEEEGRILNSKKMVVQ